MNTFFNNTASKKYSCVFWDGEEPTTCECHLTPFTPKCPFRDENYEIIAPEDARKMLREEYEVYKAYNEKNAAAPAFYDEEAEAEIEDHHARMRAASIPERVLAEYDRYLKAGEAVPHSIALAMRYLLENRSSSAGAIFDSQPTRCGHSLRSVPHRGWRGVTPLRTRSKFRKEARGGQNDPQCRD